MKKLIATTLLILISFLTFSQDNPLLKVENYTLANGLNVFLNRDTTATRVFGAVMVNAGAKHEDPNATGMAHYLEHLLFKGTDEYGTVDFEKEKPYLDSINSLYEILAKTSSEEEKVKIQTLINQQAVAASEYGLPTEFDKMLKSIGSTGVNAFTNYEMTFYHNSFPSHEIKKWLTLYAARFQNPVFRSFQSELEVVYEEKNRAMDNFERKVFEEASKHTFSNLPYGQWSVLGTVEHLKTPSLIRMYQFYEDNYVPENMALILTGNFEVDYVKPIIEQNFGAWEAAKAKPVNLPELEKLEGEKLVKKRMTPVKAGFLAYQTIPTNHPDRISLFVAEYMLVNNSETGYINQLMSNNEMLYSGGFPLVYNDAASIVFFYVPKIVGQSLKKAESKVLDQIEKVKTGDFSDELLAAAKNDLIEEFTNQQIDLTSRGILIGEAFNRGITWEEISQFPDLIDKVSKEEVMQVASKYFGEDRLKIISRTGFGKPVKLDKPVFKPVTAKQEEESEFYKEYQKIDPLDFEPRFLDFDKDVFRSSLEGGHKMILSENPLNDQFNLVVRYQIGRLHNPELIAAAGLMNSVGAGDWSLAEVKQKFAALGIDYSFSAYQNFLEVSITGREDNLEEGLELLNLLLTNPNIDENTKKIYVNRTTADYKLEKSNPAFMGGALYNYAAYGDESFYKVRKGEKALKAMDAAQNIQLFQNSVNNYEAEIIYVGKNEEANVKKLVSKYIPLSKTPKKESYIDLEGKKYDKNTILFVNNKKAIQSQVYFHLLGNEFSNDQYADLVAFNGYFGDGFSGLVLQEIREYRSLAYSAYGYYNRPVFEGNKGRFIGYIGCQGDKTNDAIPVMLGLINQMPSKPERIEALRQALKLKVVTSFPTYRELPFTLSSYELMGYKEDPKLSAYSRYDEVDMELIEKFYQEHISGNPYVITIYGDKRKIDLDELSKYGEVIELKEKDFINMK